MNNCSGNIFDRVVYNNNDKKLVELISNIPNLSAFLERGIADMVKFTELPTFSNATLQFTTSSLSADGPYFSRGSDVINFNIRDSGTF
jgi:hypothetical protein